jgi:sugar lactone lactonase YvrE
LSWDYLRPLVAQLCAALEYAHGEKVIHRDLKPANLMVDSRGRLKLADFGIAAVASDSMSRISMRHSTSGTLPYMSPQQLTGKRPQPADDIYALGATLYELLTGKPPFHTGDITHQVLHQAPELMEERLAALEMQNDIPQDVSALVTACLGKEPGQRPESARAVAEWIGLELEVKPSAEGLAAALFPQTPPTPASLVAGKPERRDGSKPARFGRNLAAVGIVVLVMAGAFWLRKDSLRRGHPNAPVAAQVATPTEPSGDLKTSPAGAPPGPAPTAAGATAEAALTLRTSNAPAPPAAGLNQEESWTFTTIAGKAGTSGSRDGIGSDARFNGPNGIAVDQKGNIYVADNFNNTIRLITSSGAVSTLAGLAGTSGSNDGLGANARFSSPHRIAVDHSGNLYVTDLNHHTIRKITPAGMVTTLAGQAGRSGSADGAAAVARFYKPMGIAVGADGNIFVADSGNNTIRKITPAGLVSTVAGQAGVKGNIDGPGLSARFDGVYGIALSARGFLYVTGGENNIIRVINPSRVVGTLAAQPGAAGRPQYATTSAFFYGQTGIAVDGKGNLYVADSGNNTIRQITTTGVVTTIGGLAGTSGSSDGAGANARFNHAWDLALDTQENFYVSDGWNNTIRKGVRHAAQPAANVESQSRTAEVPPQDATTPRANAAEHNAAAAATAAAAVPTSNLPAPPAGGPNETEPSRIGKAGSSGAKEAPRITSQPASQSVLPGANVTFQVAVAGTGPFTYQWQFNGANLPNNIITTVAGNGAAGYVGDGGAATNASLANPLGMALDAVGNLYVADESNNCVRKVDTKGVITTVAGNRTIGYSGDGGKAINARMAHPFDVVLDAAGNLYLADEGLANARIRKVDTNGIITTFAGNGMAGYSGDGGAATSASLGQPVGLALDAFGNLYIADNSNERVRKVNPNGIITTVAGNGTSGYSGDGGAATSASFNTLRGVAVDAAGSLYIADHVNNRVRKVARNGIITTVAGNGSRGYSGDGGAATKAALNRPEGLGLDAAGNLYIADTQNNRIRKVDTSGIIATVAGTGVAGYSGDGGAATSALLNSPCRVALDASGNLYLSDGSNNRIREVHFAGDPTLTLTNVSAKRAGNYRVVISTPYGRVTSAVAALTVKGPQP